MRTELLIFVAVSLIFGGFVISQVSLDSETNFPKLTYYNSDITEDEFENEFIDFITTYGKSYNLMGEYENRYSIFKENYQKIKDHNVDEEIHGFTLGVNKFADLTIQEFKKNSLGLLSFPRTEDLLKSELNSMKIQSALEDLPESVDWRESGIHVNPVKEQGTCGSCWAFSTIGSIESAFAIKTGSLPALSEQQLVHCSKGFGNGGCSGGFMEYAYKYAEKYPLCTEEEYPYEGKDSKACEHSKCNSSLYKLQGFEDIESNSKLSLYKTLNQQPVSIGVCAGNMAWQFYKKGVMKKFCGDCLDHGVVTVGYGVDKKKGDYIIVRNSWGEKWGEQGYLRISSKDETGKGTCGIYQLPSVPIVEAQE